MSTNNNSPQSPLEYPANGTIPVRIFRRNRAPLSTDYRNFKIRDFWNDTSSDNLWYLTSKSTTSGTWIMLGGGPTGDVQFLAGDSGGNVAPDGSGVIDVLGGTGAVTTGVPASNNITVDVDTNVAISYPTDSGTATPAANSLTMTGGTNINTAGAGDVVTTNLDAAIEVDSISFDAGTNLLDFYETGTWTPVLKFGGASVGITYSNQDAEYVRIGDFVHVNGNITLSSKGSSVGDARIQGLPFTASFTSCSSASWGFIDLDIAGGYSYLTLFLPAAQNFLEIQESGDNIGRAAITDVDFINTSIITFSIQYRVP